jgi:N6-adenosine-specific RNA methylase IME4
VSALPGRHQPVGPFAELNPPYSTIVADPAWPMPESGKRTRGPADVASGVWWGNFVGQSTPIPYSTMTVEDIEAMPVSTIADAHAHLYLWTVNRHIEDAYRIARAWGFRPAQLLTWAKPPMGIGFGGAFTTTTEFVLFCRRGTLKARRRVDSSWWAWSRVYVDGHIAHSAKPDAFGDLVEAVSPGPYVELFCRRPRLGWDSWGHGYELPEMAS